MRSIIHCLALPLALAISPHAQGRIEQHRGVFRERSRLPGPGMIGAVLRRLSLVCLLVSTLTLSFVSRVAAQSSPAAVEALHKLSQELQTPTKPPVNPVQNPTTAPAGPEQNPDNLNQENQEILPQLNVPSTTGQKTANAKQTDHRNANAATSKPKAIVVPVSVPAVNDCPVSDNPLLSQQPPIAREKGTRFWRPSITDDFLVLEYNARSYQTRWYDYRHHSWGEDTSQLEKRPHSIIRNGEFLPIVYAKEKMLVHVCNLRFTDIVTVSNSSTGLPEGGFDIRGSNPTTTVPTLGPALDSIQAIGATGQTATIGGLGFSATPAITTSAATGVTNGTLQRGPTGLTYTDASISASPEELALMMYGLIKNAIDLRTSIDDQNNSVTYERSQLHVRDAYLNYASTNINHLVLEASQRYDEVHAHRIDPLIKFNPAVFDTDMTNTQNLSTELTNFSGALSSQGYGSRAVTLWNNYAVLIAPLNMMEDHIKKRNCIPSTEAQAAKAAADQAAEAYIKALIARDGAQNKLKAAKAGSAEEIALQRALEEKKDALKDAKVKMDAAEATAAKKDDSTTPSNQPVNCDDWESKSYWEFLKEYKKDFYELAERDPDREKIIHWGVTTMFEDLGTLKQIILDEAGIVAALYREVNMWNEVSSIEQSDYITPIAGNALERISISVQHGFVPFALASYALSTGPTVTTPAVPTVPTAATTSTPAHTVKTVMVEVHRRANLNLIGGVMDIRVPSASYAVQQGATPAALVNANPAPVITSTTNSSGTTYTYTYSFVYNGTCNSATSVAGTVVVNTTTTSNGSPPATPNPPAAPGYSCVVQTQKSNYQLSAMVGLDLFIPGRDYFPLRRGFKLAPRNFIPAPYAVTSVTTLGNSSFGLNFEPISGVDFLVGAGMAHTTLLPSNITTSTILPSGYTLNTSTQVNWGVTWGVGFDFNLFSQIFSKGPSAASLP